MYKVGSDLSDIYLSGNLIYPTEDWGTKSAAYYCIDTSAPQVVSPLDLIRPEWLGRWDVIEFISH